MTSSAPSARRSAIAGLVLSAAIVLSQAGAALSETGEATGMAVSVIPARRHCFHDWLTASGTFAAKHAAEVRADRNGLLIDEMLVGVGDIVSPDQILARLSGPDGAPPDSAVVKAPIGGTVVAVGGLVGSYASPGARDPMFRIVSDEGLELDADLLSSKLVKVKPGMPARVHIVGLGDRDGVVTRVGLSIDAATQSGKVLVSVAEPDLRIGAFARADVDAGQHCGAAIPLSALLTREDGSVVATVHTGHVEMRQVTVGLSEAGEVEVLSGLRENDPVVARATAFLRDGDPVRAVPVGAAAGIAP